MNDAERKEIERAFRYETDEEIKRKRQVYLAFVVRQTQDEIAARAEETEANKKRYEILSQIVWRRQRSKQRREMLKEMLQWSGLVGPFVVGIGAREWLWPALRSAFGVGLSAVGVDV